MVRAELPRATWLDIVLLVPHVIWVVLAAVQQFVTNTFFIRPHKKTTVYRQVLFAVIRTHLRYIKLSQELLFPRPSTAGEYWRYAMWHRKQPVTTLANSRLPMHWIGPPNANKTLLYFHGGGYFFGASPAHSIWLSALQKHLSRPECVVSIVLVSYTLTPDAAWPQQLHDATDALQYLVKDLGRRPRDIALGGDSAGGHLAINLLTHVLHPLEGVKPLELSEPLMTAFLISPFIRLDMNHESWTTNYFRDYIPHEAAERWTDLFLGENKSRNPNNTPGLGDAVWFKGLDKVVKDILIWAGGDECLVDGIVIFDKTMKQVLPGAKLVVEEGGAHIEPILDALFGYEKTEGTKLVESWLAERLLPY